MRPRSSSSLKVALFAAALIFPGSPPLAAGDCCEIGDLGLLFPEEKVGPTRKITLPASAAGVSLQWPITDSFDLNSPFGPRQLGSAGARFDWHRGIDLRVPIGTTVRAPADAVVVFAGISPNFADPVIQLRHNSVAPFVYTLYLHMSAWNVSAGDEVTAGSPIGLSGQGTASYPHLHWEVRRGCLRQECCENPYGYMGIANNPPPAGTLVAGGFSPSRGRLLLFEWDMPKTEIDWQGASLSWGTNTLAADLDDMNALSPMGQGSLLDDPLYFWETHAYPFAILPLRFNYTFATNSYMWLVWSLDTATTSGNLTVSDAGGLSASSPVELNLPPVTVEAQSELVGRTPGQAFSLAYIVTNTDTVSRTLEFTGFSAQSLTLDVVPAGTTLAAGQSTSVTISGTLPVSFPADIGDLITLRTHVVGGSWQDVIGMSLVENTTSGLSAEWLLLH